VESARELEPGETDRLREVLERRLGRRVVLRPRVRLRQELQRGPGQR
jgi:F0F1-type ATP synthase delta subunit